MTKLEKFVKDESGATAIEYGLIAAATGLTLIVVAPQLGDAISNIFGQITEGLNNPGADSGGGDTGGGDTGGGA